MVLYIYMYIHAYIYIYICVYTAHADPFRVSESPLYPPEGQIYFNDGLNCAFSLMSVCTVCQDQSVDKRRIIMAIFL